MLDELLQLGTLGSEITLSEIERDFDEDKKQSARSERLASAKLVKDIICWKKTFDISWRHLAQNSDYTIDNRAGADEIEAEVDKKIFLSFKVTKPGGGTDDYMVDVTGFSKKLVERKIGIDYYNVSLSLEEQ